MFEHQDVLAALNGKLPLPEKITYVHGLLKERFDFIDRISVAIYDAKTDLLKTFVHSSDDENPLVLYSSKLADSASMIEILKVGRPRVVNDLNIFSNVQAEHARRLSALQYQSSYTMPMFLNGEFFGFLFFNSRRKNVFVESTLHYLDMVGHLLSLLVIHNMSTSRSLYAIVKTAANITLHRDFETGAHLDRMSNYARLIHAPPFSFAVSIQLHHADVPEWGVFRIFVLQFPPEECLCRGQFALSGYGGAPAVAAGDP